jgi:hypothetical protein
VYYKNIETNEKRLRLKGEENKMKNLKVLLAQLKVAKKYNNKTRIVSLLLEMTRYNEPVAKANPENTQVATTAKYYADVFGYLLNAINKEIEKLETENPVVTPERVRAANLAHQIFMAGTARQKADVCRKLGIWGTAGQLSWVIDILRKNIGWTTNAIENNLLPRDVQYFIYHHRDLSQQVLLDPEVVF